MQAPQIFATLRRGGRIWAVGAIHGEKNRLVELHAHLQLRLADGDRLIYLGNYLGHGPDPRGALQELLLFRRAFLARPGAEIDDIAFLRGCQEEMWQKLFQLQFAPNPSQVLAWMLDQGIGPTISAYGGNPDEGFLAIKEGPVSLNRWSGALRDAVRASDGHTQLLSSLKHAAFDANEKILFVNAGLDPARPLHAQSDSFWWGGDEFTNLKEPYGDFTRMVRGFDRKNRGVRLEDYAISLDAGAGRGGSLTAAAFDADGAVTEILEV